MQPQRRIVLIGLSSAGKTTLLKQFLTLATQKKSLFSKRTRQSSVVSPTTIIPTTDFCLEQMKYKEFELFFTDLSGSEEYRRLWRHQFTGIQGVCYVMDSSAKEKLEDSIKLLVLSLRDMQLSEAPFAIFLNKQDKEEVLAVKDMIRLINTGIRRRIGEPKQKVEFFACSGLTQDGVFEGLDWLCTTSQPL